MQERVLEIIARLLEFFIWMTLAIIPLWIRVDPAHQDVNMLARYFYEDPFWAIISTALFFFAPTFRLVFGSLPFELMRRKLRSRAAAIEAARELPRGTADNERRANLFKGFSPQTISAIEASQNLDPREMLALFAHGSQDTSADVYRRSSTFILAGVVIAAVGIVFFVVRTSEIPVDMPFMDRFAVIAPNLAPLLFIEFVAFYFLRQHRVAMDEFRYFEQVKRSREESLIIMKMFAENKTVVPTKEVLSAIVMYSDPGRLTKEQTSEWLESRKMLKDETDIFERLINAATAFKNNEKIESDVAKKK